MGPLGNLIGGLIGLGILIVFLGWMVVGIGAVPLGVIVVGVLILAVIDFVQAVRKSRNQTGS